MTPIPKWLNEPWFLDLLKERDRRERERRDYPMEKK